MLNEYTDSSRCLPVRTNWKKLHWRHWARFRCRQSESTDFLLSIPDVKMLITFSRFPNRSRKFINAYSWGLNGRETAWAARKYRGQRVLPESLMQDLDNFESKDCVN